MSRRRSTGCAVDHALGSVTGAPPIDAFDPLVGLRSAGVPVRDLGTTSVDGKPVHHYRLHFTEHFTAPTSVTSIKPPGPTAVSADLYVDVSDRLARVEEVRRTAMRTTKMQIDYSDYGVHVDIHAPRPTRSTTRSRPLSRPGRPSVSVAGCSRSLRRS